MTFCLENGKHYFYCGELVNDSDQNLNPELTYRPAKILSFSLKAIQNPKNITTDQICIAASIFINLIKGG
jgi:hypothetical protein